MQKPSTLTTFVRQQASGAPALLTMVGALALGFYFATASTSGAQQSCQVCHKRKQTLTLPCQSSAVERHLAHGDTAGPCPATQSAKPAIDSREVTAKPVSKQTASRVQAQVE